MSHLPIQHKNETTPGKAVSWLRSQKAHNYYPAYQIGPDFSDRKRFIIQCYNLLGKGSACFDRRGY